MATNKIPDIYDAIGKMTAALAKEGIAKDRQNTDQKYKFRGIDDVRNAVASLQDECNLIIVPKMVSRTEIESKTKSGGFALRVIVKIDFHFLSRVDGSEIIVPMENEAVDYSDKATNKAISQAYKAACINVFNIPTEGEQDADEERKDLQGKKEGVFDSPELRGLYTGNCIETFESVDSLLALKKAEGDYHDKLVLMSHSEDPADREAARKIRDVYTNKTREFVTANKPKPRTVADAMGSRDE